MRKLLIACLNLLLIFNSIGFQAINATEVDPPNEETYEPSLPTEETNLDDSIKENTDTSVSTEETTVDNTENDNLSNNLDEEYNTDADLSTEEDIITVDDSINEDNTLEINDSFEDTQIDTVATGKVEFLDKNDLKKYIPENITNLYFGTKSDYDLSKGCSNGGCSINYLTNNYQLYTHIEDSTNTVEVYIICNDGKKIFFPENSFNLFSSYNYLKQITFKNIDTSYVTDMTEMFYGCHNLTALDLSSFNTNNVTSMAEMFRYCEKLTTLNISNFNTSNVTNMNWMFSGCGNLANLDVSHFNTDNVTSMTQMFDGCSNLTNLDVSNFNTSNVTTMSGMFSGCSNLTSLNVSHFNTSKVTSMSGMFSDCSNLTSLDVSHFNTDNVGSFPSDMNNMFFGCKSLTELDLSNFNTHKVTSMAAMFEGCSNLTSLNISNFNTINVEYTWNMFKGCSKLSSLDLSNFKTFNVTSMSGMFSDCSNLTTLGLSNFDTSKVNSMREMFSNCSNLTSLDLSNFNTSNVIDMNKMFAHCNNLTSLDVSTFKTYRVDQMVSMFEGCSSLTILDLSSFRDARYKTNMFKDCINLKTIYATDFSYYSPYSTDMFINCYKLTGEQGTKYDSNKTDGEYARIDGKNSKLGYFSCNHTWNEGKVTTEPTCVNKGIKTFTCTKCNTTKTEDIAALGHSYTAETIKADALKTPGTCTDKAIYYKSCERCGQVDTNENNTFEGEVDSTNHNYSSEWTIDTPASCTQEGSESHHCTRCDAKTGDRPIAKTDHTWNEGKVTTEPTCVNKGIKTFTCTKCNTTKTEDIAALGHELTHVTKKDATTEDFGNIEYWNCSKCKKNFNDSEGTNEITGSTAIPKLAPSIIKGDNQSVTEKEEKALSVTSNASYDDFIEVKVDGTTLDISKYTKAKGSTIITLNADYVSILSVGTHTLDVVSKFGTATAHFKVEKKVEITPTPETNNSSTTDKTSTGWDDGGPFTTDKCGNVFDRWNNKIYEANGCNVGGYNLVRTSVID